MVFGDFIFHIAEAGFPDSQLCQLQGGSVKAFGDGFGDGVQLVLGHGRQDGLGFLGSFCQVPGLLPRLQVFVKFHSFIPKILIFCSV